MRIQNNIMAMNTHRQLGINDLAQSKSTEKLSSGYRINRAADDAAGLTISEKMRAQIRGLGQASSNALDGISLIQSAEGALDETHKILQRMRVLANKAANDVNEEEDRDAIKSEINQLTREVDRISATTEFNKKTLLDGSLSNGKNSVRATGSNFLNFDVNEAQGKEFGTVAIVAGTAAVHQISFAAASASDAGSVIGFTFSVTDADNNTKLNVEPFAVAFEVKGEMTAKEIGDAIAGLVMNELQKQGKANVYDVSVDASGQVSISAREAGAATATFATAVSTYSGAVSASASVTAGVDAKATGSAGTWDLESDGITFTSGNYSFQVEDNTKNGVVSYNVSKGQQLTLQVGANTGTDQTVKVSVDRLSTSGLGIIDLRVDTHLNAQTSINRIESAIQKVSKQRSDLGAIQNRLEHSIANLDTVQENLQASEARIRDTDMAKEMMAFTKSNILRQASTSMLAQANMTPQSVLQLLG